MTKIRLGVRLDKAQRPNSHPRFDTIARVCRALGLKLSMQHQPQEGGPADGARTHLVGLSQFCGSCFAAA